MTRTVFRCTRCRETLDGSGDCKCSRAKVAAMRAGTAPAKAVMRAACPEHTPEQQAERDANAAAITRVWGAKLAALMELSTATCDQLARWASAARKEEAQIAALRAAAATPPDAYQSRIEETRGARGITRPSLPPEYDPTTGYVADPYAAGIAARQRALGIAPRTEPDPSRDLSAPPDPYANAIAAKRAAMAKKDEERRRRRR